MRKVILLQGVHKTNSQIAYYESLVKKYNCKTSNALHIGCGAGYTSLMLSKTFESVSHTSRILYILSVIHNTLGGWDRPLW